MKYNNLYIAERNIDKKVNVMETKFFLYTKIVPT